MRLLSNLEFNLNQALNMVLQKLASNPTRTEGRMWYNTTTKTLLYSTDAADITLSSDRSTHTGTQTASTISDFNTAVRTNRLDQMAAPTAAVNMNSQRLTGLAAASGGTDAVTLTQLQDATQNRGFKDPVRAATTANISLTGTQTIDGVALVAGDRVLVKDQTTGSQNGIYTVAAGAWVRAVDFDSSADAQPGSIVPVTEGTANADKLFILATNGPITLATTALVFSAYGTATGEVLTGGAGLVKTGTVMDVGAGTGITVNADNVQVRRDGVNGQHVPLKYAANVGDGAATSFTINHALGTTDVIVQVYELTGSKYQVFPDIRVSDANNVILEFATAPASGAYRVVVLA